MMDGFLCLYCTIGLDVPVCVRICLLQSDVWYIYLYATVYMHASISIQI